MCYRALTCNVEIYGYIFLSCGNERKIKISYSLVVQKKKKKNLQVPLGCISHALDPLGFGA